MARRLMVTGADGFVAGSIVGQAGPEWELHALSLTEVEYTKPGLHWYVFDMRDTAKLKEVFEAVKPDAVVHTAAMADIDFCQANQDIAEAVNVGVTRSVAECCAACGAKMIFLSTDTVFDGKKGMYTEQDAPGALNFYAETKVRAEEIVRATAAKWIITRLSLVMGLPVIGSGNSFLAKTFAAWNEGKQAGFPDEEIRTPVDVITLGRAFLELAASDFGGYMHLSGCSRLSRYDMAVQIAEKLGFSKDLVVVKNPSATPGRAPRPHDASLDNSLARKTLKTPMRNLDEAVDLVLATK
jgi:dTDP-4-dehydrorhamnose reductase